MLGSEQSIKRERLKNLASVLEDQLYVIYIKWNILDIAVDVHFQIST